MEIRITQESALNLTLQGSSGSFHVGSGQPRNASLQVKYFLTHVGLNFSSGSNDALLSALAPVREVFDFASLDFDEIMQRDIDDARVSAELIPYLLDEKSSDTIKLFPPIVVMVLPIEEGRNKPADYYPVTSIIQEADNGVRGYPIQITRAGPTGREVFQFEQPIIDNLPIAHDKARLKLNTHKTRLVIVDGQHRAMALLAIYRNLKDQWTDERRAPFKEYYSEWTPNYINKFSLGDIDLPVILCTVPALDSNYQGDFDLKKAARAIFLTLNKTARKVSESRNKLLDDNDLIAFFMRKALSKVKDKNIRSEYAFRIWNVELDQFGDKLKIQSPIAITGVNHFYYIIENCLLDSGDVKGVAPRSGKFYKRTTLNDCLDRLDGRNLLGSIVADSMRRDSFTNEAATKLEGRFHELYGKYILISYEKFSPYDRHNRAVLMLETTIDNHQDRQLRPILFEGQGIGRVFEEHRKNLRDKLKYHYFNSDVPEVEESVHRLDSTAARIRDAISSFRKERAKLCLAEIDKKTLRDDSSEIDIKLVEWFNNLYDDVFSTVAFQCALICGFFGEFEKALSCEMKDASSLPTLNKDEAFEEYIQQVNHFFTPRTPSKLATLIKVFSGDTKLGDWRITATNHTFRHVVYRGEMQPDHWPKYKYLFLEIWKPTHTFLCKVVSLEKEKCRKEVFSALHEHYQSSFCRDNRKLQDDLSKEENAKIFDQAFSAFEELLKNINTEHLDRKTMKTAASEISASSVNDAEQENDICSNIVQNPDESQ